MFLSRFVITLAWWTGSPWYFQLDLVSNVISLVRIKFGPSGLWSSIWLVALVAPCFTNPYSWGQKTFFIVQHTNVKQLNTWSHLARVLGLPAIPRQIADTSDDFPVPLGPIIRFKFGPGSKIQIFVCPSIKICNSIRHNKCKPSFKILLHKICQGNFHNRSFRVDLIRRERRSTLTCHVE